MTHKNDGGPAFPHAVAISPSGGVYGSEYFGSGGMSLRDWFAGQDIHALIVKSEDRDGGWSEHTVAAGAYTVADAMLAARATPVSDAGGAGRPTAPKADVGGEA